MTNRNADSSLGEGGNNLQPPPTGAPPPEANDNRGSRNGTKVYKSGPLFLSSRGIGWTSWKKRWFILTRTSLVFFRNDPSAIPQKGSEVNLTLGGIDLNSSGSVVVKADKKLLTVLFPDGRDGNGRAFTLKAETTEDLYEWKAALEEALANAPSAALVMGQNGIFKSDKGDAPDGSVEQSKDRLPAKSFVIGGPVLLALEDIDGTPSFLEKALRYLEEHGVKVEGILRQAADVEDVERRIREYEQGKTDFSAEEDPHVIADCIKYVLRELPSSPVPASCCNALLEAYRTERSMRVSAMRTAICDTFPEPNRRLLQRILVMMQAVAANKVENRMSISAVAACMAPLLLRPLLAGDCELEHNFDMGGDGSIQLLQAAAAANHAQAIVITLLEEYENLFGEGSISSDLYSDTEESGSESEELSDDGTYEDDEDDEDVTEGSDADMDEEIEGASSCTISETGNSGDEHQQDNKGSESLSSHSNSHELDDDLDLDLEASLNLSRSRQRSRKCADVEVIDDIPDQGKNTAMVQANELVEQIEDDNPEINTRALPSESIQRSFTVANGPVQNSKRPTVWGRTGAKKNLSMENIDVPIEDEDEIQRLEEMKISLQDQITAEKIENAVLLDDLENRKNALHKRRLALEQDVAELQEQLQKEKELGAVLEAGLKMPQGPAPISSSINERTKAHLMEIAEAEADISSLKQKTDYVGVQVTQQREQNSVYVLESSSQTSNQGRVKEKEKDFEASASSGNGDKSMRPKDTQVSKAQSEKDAKNQPFSLPSKPLAQNQQSDSLHDLKSAGTQAASPLVEQGIGRSSTTNSRRSTQRGETGPTSSALTKLTNRLTFLKERRNQIANELQTMDKGRNSGQAPLKRETGNRQSETLPPNVSVNKFKGSDDQSLEKGRSGLDSDQYQQNIDRGGVTEGSSFQNADTNRKLDIIHSLQTKDRGIRCEDQSTPNLDREKSESFPNNDKTRDVVPPRTFSR